jgi:histone H3/H4
MPLVVVKSQIASIVREVAKQQGSSVDNVASDFAQELDRKVRELIADAVRRATQNNRRTLMARDV